jgi:leucyl-tRNA synthetase
MSHRYGADGLRTYLMFIGPYDATMAWNERALMGVKRFLDRFERFVESKRAPPPWKASNANSSKGNCSRLSLFQGAR